MGIIFTGKVGLVGSFKAGVASYTLSRSAASVDEGSSFTITLTTTLISNGTSVPYTISGVATTDISNAPLTGNFVINNNTASLVVNVSADLTTEGPETFTISIDGTDETISVVINDTSGGGDPYFADVVMLQHFDGTNNSTTMPDSSSLNIGPNLVNTTGTTVLDTALPKFGTASMKWVNAYPGAGYGAAFIAWPYNTQRTFGTGDFTIEFWVQNTRYGTGVRYLRSIDPTYTVQNWYMQLSSTGKLQFIMYNAGQTVQFTMGNGTSDPVLPINTWGFVALTRENGTFKLWLNGQQAATPYTAYSGTMEQAATGNSILLFGDPTGGGNGNRNTTGHLDELRVTKGVARYTAPFSVPTEAFKSF